MLTGRSMGRLRTVSVVGLVALGLALGGLAGLASRAFAGPSGSAEAIDACDRVSDRVAEYGTGIALYRAEATTVQAVVAWQEQRYENLKDAPAVAGLRSPIRNAPAAGTVTVCLYSGTFVTPVGPPNEQGVPKPRHNLLRLLVFPNGEIVLDSAGYAGRMQPETPGDWSSGQP